MNEVPAKYCTECEELKPLTDYHYKNKQAGIRHNKCKDVSYP